MFKDIPENVIQVKANQVIKQEYSLKPHKKIKKVRRVREPDIKPMESKDFSRQNSLHKAARDGDGKWLKYLAENSKDEALIESDIYGKTPLHYAAEKGLLASLLEGRIFPLIFLQIQDPDGNTPLHIMAQYGHYEKSILNSLKLSEINILFNIKNSDNYGVLDILKK
jgi:ankyrin repeat protein